MQSALLKLLVRAQMALGALKEEEGQDLIEYALVVALICFAAVSSMGKLANGINNAFSGIANMLNTNVP